MNADVETVLRDSLYGGPWTPEEWNELLAASETNTIFQTFQWHAAWWRSYGSGFRAFIVAGLDQGRLVGIAPLMISRCRRMSFIGDGKSDYHDVIVAAPEKADFLDAVFAVMTRRKTDWDTIALTNIPESSSTLSGVLIQCRKHGLLPLLHKDVVNHVLVVEGEASQVRDIVNRSELRRRDNYLQRTGILNYYRIADRLTAERLLAVFFEQHVMRWKGTRTRSLFERSENRQFYTELLKELLPSRWLHWSLLEFEGRPIAFNFGFDYNGVLTWYKPSFDAGIAKRSPGKVLLRHLIAHALEQGKRELDFTVGDELFKQRYKNRTRKNANVAIFHGQLAYHRHLVTKHLRHAVRFACGWQRGWER